MTRQPPPPLFDSRLRALRRDRACRSGPELFLLDRAFDDCLERLRDIRRPVRNALLIGAPSPEWRGRLEDIGATVRVIDPGSGFAAAAGGTAAEEDRIDLGCGHYDVVVAVGTLDTVNDLGAALQSIRRSLRPDSPLIGALAGGDSLSTLRGALIEADRATGAVAARTHPRIDPSSLAGLLAAAGFAMPVVEVERVRLRYRSLGALVADLRKMGASIALTERAPGRGRQWAARAAAAFANQAEDGRTAERIDILHFIGWSPPRAGDDDDPLRIASDRNP